MVGPYHDGGACGRCLEGVGITGGGYTHVWERGRDPRILPEYGLFGLTVSGVERPDCSAIATSSAEEEILVGWGVVIWVLLCEWLLRISEVAVAPVGLLEG